MKKREQKNIEIEFVSVEEKSSVTKEYVNEAFDILFEEMLRIRFLRLKNTKAMPIKEEGINGSAVLNV